MANQIANLQSVELFKELSDAEITTVVGGANPTTEVGKASLKGLESLLASAESKLEEEIKKLSNT